MRVGRLLIPGDGVRACGVYAVRAASFSHSIRLGNTTISRCRATGTSLASGPSPASCTPPPTSGWTGRASTKRGFDWREGNTNWTIDYPALRPALSAAVRRLTRMHARRVEQPVNLDDDDDVFNYPWLYAVEVGHWELTDPQIAKFREFLLRGGFFMCDDFHGTDEWDVFVYTHEEGFPGPADRRYPERRPDLPHRVRSRRPLPGARRAVPQHRPHLREGRLRAPAGAASTTTTAGSWWRSATTWTWATPGRHADDPQYPEKFSALGIRIGVNYIIYAMTH